MQTKKIKVLHPITRLILGGAQENTMFTAPMQHKQRYHTEILSGPQTGSEGSLIDEVRQRAVPLTILRQMVRQISPFNDMAALWKMTALMRREGYQIVHTHSSKAGILGRIAARLAGVPVILHTVHGWSFHDYMSPLVRNIYIFLERWCETFTDALIVVARQDIDKGLQAGIGKADKYHLIRSAIPLDEFDPLLYERQAVRSELGIPADAFVIGNVGRFSAQKNPLDWVKIAGEVGRRHPQTHFLLVGDGPLRAEVEKQLETEGLSGRATLTGLRRDPARMMAAMDIFLLTSLWEGLPRAIPEAMSMQLPVIANLADGTAEAIIDGQTGYLCVPGDLPAMVERCSQLIVDQQKCKQIGHNGRSYAQKEFDLRQMIAQIDALYQHIIEKKSIQTGG